MREFFSTEGAGAVSNLPNSTSISGPSGLIFELCGYVDEMPEDVCELSYLSLWFSIKNNRGARRCVRTFSQRIIDKAECFSVKLHFFLL